MGRSPTRWATSMAVITCSALMTTMPIPAAPLTSLVPMLGRRRFTNNSPWSCSVMIRSVSGLNVTLAVVWRRWTSNAPQVLAMFDHVLVNDALCPCKIIFLLLKNSWIPMTGLVKDILLDFVMLFGMASTGQIEALGLKAKGWLSSVIREKSFVTKLNCKFSIDLVEILKGDKTLFVENLSRQDGVEGTEA